MEWLIEIAIAKYELPGFIIPALLLVGPILFKVVGFLFTWFYRRKQNRHVEGYSREAREWAIGEISFLSEDARLGFIDPRSGRKNVRFNVGTISDSSTVVLGQRVRFLADWSKPQPIATSVRPFPRHSVKT